MTVKTAYRLAGWIRLVTGDCLGIAVFTDGTNTEFVAETDDRLVISEFYAFYNVENYQIERGLSPLARTLTYSAGSSVPIPFSRSNLTIIAHPDEGATAFLADHEADRHDRTVKAVAEIIEKAESGAFEKASHASLTVS